MATQYDDLGFVVNEDEIHEKTQAYAVGFAPKATRRLRRFELAQKKLPLSGSWTDLPIATLKTLARKGLPPQHRADVWWNVLGCHERFARSPELYRRYLDEALPPKVAETISVDLARTFPNHRRFETTEGKQDLRDVLHAYARHAPQVGYCQGLNFIAALMLVMFLDTEKAFWAMACALDRLGVQGYYSDGMTLLRADMRVLDDVVKQMCPKLSRCCHEQKVEISWLCEEWYISWFAKSLPLATTLRVWDALFFEGYKILFRVAVSVLKFIEPEVLKNPSLEEIMVGAKQWARGQVAHNELLKASYKSPSKPLKRKKLEQARQEALCLLDEEDRARSSRRSALKSANAA